jgi:hypothetical protein
MIHPKFRRICLIVGALLLFSIGVVACSQDPETVEVTRIVEVPVEVQVPAETVEVEVPVEVTRIVEVMVEAAAPETAVSAVSVVPFEEQWASSPHADASAEAFVHWDGDDPAEVPANCAKCHSTTGFMDFVGADGSAFGSVEVAVPVGEVVECQACHKSAKMWALPTSTTLRQRRRSMERPLWADMSMKAKPTIPNSTMSKATIPVSTATILIPWKSNSMNAPPVIKT